MTTRLPRCIAWIFMIGCLLVSGCGRPASSIAEPGELSGRLTVTGSSTIGPLVAEIAKRFEAEHPAVRIDIQTGGSSRGIADTRGGAADLGMVSRDLASDETDLTAFPIARDGVGLIVHAANPISSLSHDQVIAIFTGRASAWAEMGWSDSADGARDEITVVSKADGRATLAVFLDHFGLESSRLRPDIVIGHNEQGIQTVAGNPRAIGYVSIGTAEASIAQGVPIRLLPIDGVAATTNQVADGSFPLARSLHLVAAGSPSGLARSFLDYCRSEAVHDLVEAQFFAPIRG